MNINFTDKAILTWGTTAGTAGSPHRTAADGTTITNFVVDTGDTWNFASSGSILNKVVAGNNTTNGNLGGAAAAAIINGQLLGSSAKVYVLANGGIIVGNGAQLNTQNLVLSTLGGENDGTFITLGDLMFNGSSTGSISLGTITSGGGIKAVAGSVTTAGGSVAGDLILRSVTAASAINLSAAQATTVGGNLNVMTNNGAITQGAGFGVTVGAATSGTQDTTLNSGTGAIALNVNTNDFERLMLTTSTATGTVSLRDANIVTLGTSSVGGDLSVKVGGMVNTTGIATDGAVTVGGNSTFISTTSANSAINVANGSSFTGYVNARSSGGAITINATGNLILGNVTGNVVARDLDDVAYPAAKLLSSTTATATVAGGAVTGVTLTIPAGGLAPIYTGNATSSEPTFSSPIASGNVTLGTGGAAGTIASLGVPNGGSGYTGSVPVVTLVGGGGSGATATATVVGDVVTALTVTNPGSGYTSAPTVVITHPNANAARAEGTVTRNTTTGLVTGITITNAGVGYGTAVPTITFPTVNAANNYSTGNVTANSTGTLTAAAVDSAGAAIAGAGVRSGLIVSLSAGTSLAVESSVNANGNNNSSFTARNGSVTFNGTVTGNRMTVTATGGNITQGAGGVITTNNGTTGSTFNAGTGVVTLDGAANFFSVGAPIHVTASSATLRQAGNATSGNLVIGTTNVTGNYTVSTLPVAASANRNVTLGFGDAANATSLTVGGILSVTANGTNWIRDNNDSRLDVFGGITLQTGSATLAGGDITLDAATAPGALTPSVRLGVIAANTGVASSTGTITLSESTTLNLGNITGVNLTASSATGGIIDTGVINLTGFTNATTTIRGTATLTVSGNNNVVLDTNTNTIPHINLVGGKDNSVTALNSASRIDSTLATGNTTLGSNTGVGIALGNFVTSGNVTVNSGSYIDNVGVVDIGGNLTLTATGNIASAATLTTEGVSFGSIYAPTASINNTTGRLNTMSGSNLAGLSYATAPTVTVTGGSIPTTAATATVNILNGIVDSTTLAIAGGAGYTVAPTVTLSAPAAGGTQATATATIAGGAVTGITITNAGSGYAAAPTITLTGGGSPTVVATVTPVLGATGQIASFNVTNNATNGGGTGGGAVRSYATGLPISIDLAGATNTSMTQSAGTMKVAGTTTISSPGNALLYRGNDFANVVLNNSTGGALVNDVSNLTVSGVAAGNLEVRSGANGAGAIGTAITGGPVVEANPWNLVLGNLNVGSLTATASNGGAANSGTLTQASGTTIHSFGTTVFATTNNTINIGNNGNNFGRIQVNNSPGASVAITIVEDGTMKLGNLNGRGTTTLTSRFGGIIEDPAADVVITQNGTLVANAANGSILIGNTTHTAGTTTANIVTLNATAPTGQVAVTSNNSTALGNINANSLTVDVTGGNGNITQSGVATIFGTSTFSATNNITLTNNANNFGRVFLTTTNASRDIQITEGGTLNLGRVTMPASSTGNFTATSISGDIIDTGLGGVRPGGVVGTVGTGSVTLSAAAGNIVLDDPTTDFPTTGGVLFTAGNVTLSPLGGAALYLGSASGTAVATGNLTVTSATGSIFNAGPVNVTGDAFFQSGSGDIFVTNSSNNFGTVKFAGKIVSITEAGHMTLVTGSSATGAATFTTAGGNIDVVNRGGTISLASTGLFNASGSITLPKLIQVSDTLTVSAAGTKDLSKLSVSGDLGNKNPQNFGTGTYLPPLP